MDSGRDASGGIEFVGSVPAVYQRLLVPMIFQAAAGRLAAVVASESPRTILETAAGTGVLTRALIECCPDAAITATDLNGPMLEVAAPLLPAGAHVTWQQADALDLPFDDEGFDVVVCQFGVMFFPDKVGGYREARRVLRPSGAFVFNVWDSIEANEIPRVIEAALNEAVLGSPFGFMSSIPHGYGPPQRIREDLAQAGLETVSITAVDGTARTTAADAATAFCQGTPLRAEIEKSPTLNVEDATRIAEAAVLHRFGAGTFEAPIRSFEVMARPTG